MNDEVQEGCRLSPQQDVSVAKLDARKNTILEMSNEVQVLGPPAGEVRGRVILRDVAEGMQERVSSFDWFHIVF